MELKEELRKRAAAGKCSCLYCARPRHHEGPHESAEDLKARNAPAVMTAKEALEVVLAMAERYREGEGSELCGTREREALEAVEILKNNIMAILP